MALVLIFSLLHIAGHLFCPASLSLRFRAKSISFLSFSLCHAREKRRRDFSFLSRRSHYLSELTWANGVGAFLGLPPKFRPFILGTEERLTLLSDAKIESPPSQNNLEGGFSSFFHFRVHARVNVVKEKWQIVSASD